LDWGESDLPDERRSLDNSYGEEGRNNALIQEGKKIANNQKKRSKALLRGEGERDRKKDSLRRSKKAFGDDLRGGIDQEMTRQRGSYFDLKRGKKRAERGNRKSRKRNKILRLGSE